MILEDKFFKIAYIQLNNIVYLNMIYNKIRLRALVVCMLSVMLAKQPVTAQMLYSVYLQLFPYLIAGFVLFLCLSFGLKDTNKMKQYGKKLAIFLIEYRVASFVYADVLADLGTVTNVGEWVENFISSHVFSLLVSILLARVCLSIFRRVMKRPDKSNLLDLVKIEKTVYTDQSKEKEPASYLYRVKYSFLTLVSDHNLIESEVKPLEC